MSKKKGILIIANLDTRGQEFRFVKDLIEKRGHRAILLDFSMEGEPQKKGKVFIGHGKNVIVRGKVKDFIKEGCDLDPMILEELPSEGMTVIEKLEKYGRTADCAILILTADDLVKDKGAPRARQNVIQELGWFQGVIGRNRTAILKQEGVEIASNIAGVVYFGFKDNEVEIIFESLRRELKKADLL